MSAEDTHERKPKGSRSTKSRATGKSKRTRRTKLKSLPWENVPVTNSSRRLSNSVSLESLRALTWRDGDLIILDECIQRLSSLRLLVSSALKNPTLRISLRKRVAALQDLVRSLHSQL